MKSCSRSTRAFGFGATMVLGALGQNVSFAQTAVTADKPAALEEIIVTAQKRSENLQNVPIAVTALSADELKGGNIDGQLTLPKLTPNLNFAVVATFAATYIRGVGTQYANPGLEPSVPVYFDDTYVPRAATGIFNFNDIERIEVLKGPQGTLYGRNVTGGTIRIITHDPKLGVVEGSADATYGTDNRVLVGGVINLPVGEKAALRFAAQHDQNDGYLRNNSPNRLGDVANRDASIFTGKFLYKPTDKLTIKISGDYSKKDDNEGITFQNVFPAPQQVGLAFGGCGNSGFYSICNDVQDGVDHVRAYGVTARVDYDFGMATLSSITSYRNEKEDDSADLDATSAPLLHSHGLPFTREYTQEFQLASNSTGPLKYLAGLYYLTERASYIYNLYGAAIDGDPNYSGLAAALGVNAPGLDVRAQGDGIKTRSFAPYLQVDYEINDQFTLTAGARYTVEKKTLLNYDEGFGKITADGKLVPGTFVSGFGLGALGSPFLGGICSIPSQALCQSGEKSLKFNKFTPKLTLSYKPNTELMLYVTASRGFKSGGFNLPSYAFVDSVNPETLDDFEAGVKYQSGAFRFNGAAFFYNYKDLQVQITDPANGTTFNKNGASAHVYGAEGDFTWLASSHFELGLGGGLLSAKYTTFPLGNCFVPNYLTASCANSAVHPAGVGAAAVGNSFLATDLEGYTLVNAPKFTGYARGQFTQPLGGGYGTIRLSGIVNYRSKSYFDVASQAPDDARTLLSARVQWTSEADKYTLGVYGENLGGKEYYVSRTIQAAGGFQVPGPPRQVYVTAGVKF